MWRPRRRHCRCREDVQLHAIGVHHSGNLGSRARAARAPLRRRWKRHRAAARVPSWGRLGGACGREQDELRGARWQGAWRARLNVLARLLQRRARTRPVRVRAASGGNVVVGAGAQGGPSLVGDVEERAGLALEFPGAPKRPIQAVSAVSKGDHCLSHAARPQRTTGRPSGGRCAGRLAAPVGVSERPPEAPQTARPAPRARIYQVKVLRRASLMPALRTSIGNLMATATVASSSRTLMERVCARKPCVFQRRARISWMT